ncbi:MAG: RCC1 domain-containing protein [Kofleriaceae bacterium]
MRVALVVLLLVGCGRHGFEERPDARDQDDAVIDPGIVQLSLRGSAVCVRTGDGRVACWGRNDRGQIGNGTRTFAEATPHIVAVNNIVTIATGEYTGFAIDRDGTLWAWGDNEFGQLGLGTAGGDSPSPLAIPVPEPVVTVAGGQYHTCAVTAGAGELYCWGDNACGQLGTGDMVASPSPRKVPGVSGVETVTVNDSQTCFTDTANNLKCMGGAYVTAESVCENVRLAPVAPIGLPVAIDVAGGCHMSMCGIDPAGDAWCWGDNVAGVLGDGAATARLEPSRVSVVSNMSMVRTGYTTSCGATAIDDVFCWGDNTRGQLGIDNMALSLSTTPLQVPFFNGQPIDEIETGCSNTCARSGHDVYCWGDNAEWVIDATTVNAYRPVQRLGLPF